jgi:parallel beta-helix repeat protein
MTNRWLIILIVFGMTVGSVSAEDILVPDDYITIGDAMEFAQYGDTIYVKAGRYNERISIKEGVNLVSFAGEDGDELVEGPGHKKVLRRTLRTIIDGEGIETPGYLVSFPKDTTASMRMDGFTITNMPEYRSGLNLFLVEIRGCSPVFVNNIVSGNRSWGGVLCTGLGIGMGPPLETVAKPVIRNNVSYDNHGPGISNGANSAAVIVDNEFFENRFPGAGEGEDDAPGIGMREYARPRIENNICYRNGAGIGGLNLDSHDDPLIVKDNTLYYNRRAGLGLRALGKVDSNVNVIIESNKIFGNLRAGIRLSKVDQARIQYNVIANNRRTGISFFNLQEISVEDNDISGNLRAGMRVLNVPQAVFKRNHVYNNVTAGIDFVAWQANNNQ